MERRQFLASGSLSALALLPPSRVFAAQGSPDDHLHAEMDTIFAGELQRDPETATELGLDTGARAALRGQLDDRSPAGRAHAAQATRDDLARLRAVPEAGLTPAARRHRAIAIYLREQKLAPRALGAESAQRPYPVTQQQGAYFAIPDFLNTRHPVQTSADAEAYLVRLAQFARTLDDEAATQREASARGLTAPAWSIDLALGQIASLRGVPAASSGLVSSLARRAAAKGLPGDWAQRATRLVESEVYPALDRHAAMLREVQAMAAPGDGLWRVPQGDALYAMALAEATTTSLSAEDIHRIGLDHVADLTARLDTLLARAGMTGGSVGERLTRLNTAPDQLYPDTDAGREALLADLNTGIAQVRQHLGGMFNDPPNDPLEIRRVAPEIQDGAPNGYYYRAPLDGSRPAIYWINLKSTADWPRYQLPDLTYHEGIPGHHLQLSYVRHSGTLPLLLRNVFISAYGEGWALYAEQLAAELGLMPGLIEAGYLQSLLFRSARLVVDTGIHAKRWTRAQATDYLVGVTGMTRPRSQREIDRYCTMAGQACSYKIGHDTWARLRTRAQTALGDKFSLPWFHDVLKDGLMPLSMLEARVDERIAEAKKA